MTIMKEGFEFVLYCDECYEKEYFDTFQDAVDFCNENGWTIGRADDEWYNNCPECAG